MEFFDSIQAFWTEIETVFSTGFLGQPIGRGLLALAVLLFSFVLRRLIAILIIGTLRRIAARTVVKFDDEIVEAIEQPVILVPVAGGIFFAGRILGLGGEGIDVSLLATKSLLVFAVFWTLYRLVRPAVGVLAGVRSVLGDTFFDWLIKILQGAIVFVGAAAMLDVWGIPVLPFLASLSLLSVAVALGAQDLFKNLIAGMLIIGERRFAKGDWIKVDGVVEGTVEQIGFRSTHIRRFDKAPVHVPNAKLADNPVTNFSRMTHRRIYWMIGLEYRTTIEQLAEVRGAIETYILNSDDFAQPPEVTTFVRVDRFSDSSIDLALYAFTKTTVWTEWLEIKEHLAYEIKRIVETAGTGFAFPSQSIYVETMPDGQKPDIFEPPSS